MQWLHICNMVMSQRHCIFKNCQKVYPGHYLKIELTLKNQEQIQYWNVYDYYNKPSQNFLQRS